TIKVNAVPVSVGIRDIDTGKDFYWSKGSNEITQDASAAALLDSDILQVEYIGQYEMVLMREDLDEQDDRRNIEGGSGIYESIQGDGVVLTTMASAQEYADALIARNAPIPSQVTIV